jgi:hypothetical protein
VNRIVVKLAFLVCSTGVTRAEAQSPDAPTTLGQYGHVTGNDHREPIAALLVQVSPALLGKNPEQSTSGYTEGPDQYDFEICHS